MWYLIEYFKPFISLQLVICHCPQTEIPLTIVLLTKIYFFLRIVWKTNWSEIKGSNYSMRYHKTYGTHRKVLKIDYFVLVIRNANFLKIRQENLWQKFQTDFCENSYELWELYHNFLSFLNAFSSFQWVIWYCQRWKVCLKFFWLGIN